MLFKIASSVLVLGLALSPAVAADNPTVVIDTNKGQIEAVLYADKAPITVKNFLQYVEADHYAGTIFHRVIPNFMIQGGGFTKSLKQKPTRDSIENEADNGLKNERGTLAMARTSAKDSARAQFFINLKHNRFLNHGVRDYGYAVFGKVTKGMDVVDAIAKVETGSKGPFPKDVPQQQVIIESISVEKADK